jgi:hypothetical protein
MARCREEAHPVGRAGSSGRRSPGLLPRRGGLGSCSLTAAEHDGQLRFHDCGEWSPAARHSSVVHSDRPLGTPRVASINASRSRYSFVTVWSQCRPRPGPFRRGNSRPGSRRGRWTRRRRRYRGDNLRGRAGDSRSGRRPVKGYKNAYTWCLRSPQRIEQHRVGGVAVVVADGGASVAEHRWGACLPGSTGSVRAGLCFFLRFWWKRPLLPWSVPGTDPPSGAGLIRKRPTGIGRL